MGDILLVRHGKTAGNERHAYIGRQTDEELSLKGKEELLSIISDYKAIIEEYNNIEIFVSSMKRCLQTADILFPEIEQCVIDDLAEMDFGIFEGKNFKELENNTEYRIWVESECENQIPEGEKKEDFSNRSFKAFEKVLNNKRDLLTVIVCHGGTIMSIMEKLAEGKYYDYFVENGYGYLIRYSGERDGIYTISYDCLRDRFSSGSNNR